MGFGLPDALPLLRCPQTGGALFLRGDHVVTEHGTRYAIHHGIVDLVAPTAQLSSSHSDYDAIAGLRYNLFLFNPFTMAFTWGFGVLQVPWLLRPARELGTGVFLEVPCGTGIFTTRAYRQHANTRILAIDYSMGMLQAAKARAARHGVDNAVFVRADVARLPIADGCLDGCLSMAGFHAFPDPAAAAAQIGRVLKPGATLAASVACSEERWLSDVLIERLMKPRGYFSHGLPAATYVDFLERAGFEGVRARMAGAVAVLRGTKMSAASS